MTKENNNPPSVFDSIRNIKNLYEPKKEEDIKNPFEDLFSNIWKESPEEYFKNQKKD